MLSRDFFKFDHVPGLDRKADRGLYDGPRCLPEFEVEVPVVLKFRIRAFNPKGARHSAHMIALMDVTDESVTVTCDVEQIKAEEVKK